MTIAPITRMKAPGKGLNPKTLPKGVKGKIRVKATTNKVARSKYLPGRLFSKGLRLRITSTIKDAEMTDSMNHPVRNWVSEACKKYRRAPKVR